MIQSLLADLSENPRTYRWAYLLALAWILSMIGLPILIWNLGETVIPSGVYLAAILQGGAVFVMVQAKWGFIQTLRTFLLVAVLTWFAEWLGHNTGFPFGAYHYTDRLQPQIAGVPLLIPIAWFMLLPACWAISQMIVTAPDSWQRRLQIALVSAGALTAWDLFLDPQMVAWQFWLWDSPSGYFGIPLVNYFGWLLVSAVVTYLINPRPLPFLPLGLIYATVWILQSIGQAFFWNQIGPAVFGFFGMGFFLVLALIRYRKQVS
jgi:lycopene beta-cyclase